MRNDTDWQHFATPFGFIRLILLVAWDPIGVLGHVGAMDEYDSYAREVYGMLRGEATRLDLIRYLRRIESKNMGVRGDASLSAVADKLLIAFANAQRGKFNVEDE